MADAVPDDPENPRLIANERYLTTIRSRNAPPSEEIVQRHPLPLKPERLKTIAGFGASDGER